MSCLVHGDSSGAGGSSCCGHSQPPAPLSLKWRRSLRDPVRAPDSWSCPEEASASELALEGFLFLWAVLSCLFSPGGLLIPPHFPREFFLGGGSKSSGCRGRAEGTEAKAPEDHLPWPPEPPAPPWPPEPPAPPWPPELPAPPWHPELPAPPWSLSVCSALEVPVLRSCLCLSWWARAPPPPSSLMELYVSYVRVLLCASSAPASCVHIWFVSCPCFLSLWVNSCPAVCMWLC